MPRHDPNAALRRVLAGLRRSRVATGVVAALKADSAAVRERLKDTVIREVAAYSESNNPDVLPELEAHVGEHVGEILRLLAGGTVGEFGFVTSYARRRAAQKFPLEAILHAYRCQRDEFSRWLADTASVRDDVQQAVENVGEFAIGYTDTTSTLLAADYVAQTRLLAEAEGDRRTELLGILLSGYDESDARVARILRRAGYLEQRQSFCVVLARSVDPVEMENPPRARRMAEAIAGAVSGLPVRTLVGLRDNVVTAVFSATRRLSGWTAPQSTLAERLKPELLRIGPAAVIGMSNDQPSTAHIPVGLREARMALDLASVSERVVQFSTLPLRRLLVYFAGPQVQWALPGWTDTLLAADRKARGALLETLRALADADMNVLKTARCLSVHPNTVYTRLQRIADLTGLDAQRYHALNELLLAADCRER